MTEANSNQPWSGEDRRRGTPPMPLFAELLMESQWRPTDRILGSDGGWFRANGFAVDRRQRSARG